MLVFHFSRLIRLMAHFSLRDLQKAECTTAVAPTPTNTMIVISYQLPKLIYDHTYLITKYKNSLLKCHGDYNIKCKFMNKNHLLAFSATVYIIINVGQELDSSQQKR